jgi:hypothetical protein
LFFDNSLDFECVDMTTTQRGNGPSTPRTALGVVRGVERTALFSESVLGTRAMTRIVGAKQTALSRSLSGRQENNDPLNS